MIRLILVLLISLIPLFIYCYLYNKSKKKALENSTVLPSFISPALLKAVVQFLVLALLFFIIFITFAFYSSYDENGCYIPATVIENKIIKGYVTTSK